MTSKVQQIGNFSVGKVLGSGMQGEVRLGYDRSSNQQVALKFIDKTNMRQSSLKSLEREIYIMKSIDHPNKLRLIDLFLDFGVENKNFTVLVLEIAPNGELFDYLMHSGFFEESLARTYFRQLMSALHTCHLQGIFHRDIKPENILLDSKFQLKIADFGLANFADTNTLLDTECGTKSYMAPEIISRQPYEGSQVDVWSSGVVLFIMLCGSPPFEVAARSDWWFNAISLNRYDRFWAAHLRGAGHMKNLIGAQHFIERIFRPDPNARLTIDQMTKDDWFNGAVLSSEQIFTEMNRRKQHVENAKEEEMMAAMRTKQQGNRNNVDVFNTATYRSLATSTYEQFLASVEGRQAMVIFSGDSKDESLAKLKRELLAIDENAAIDIAGNYLNTSIRMPPTKIELEDEVIEVPGPVVTIATNAFQGNSDNLCILDIQRKAGDILAFHKLFKTVKATFSPPEIEEATFTETMEMI